MPELKERLLQKINGRKQTSGLITERMIDEVISITSEDYSEKLLDSAIKLFEQSYSSLISGKEVKELVKRNKKEIFDISIFNLSESIILTMLEKKKSKNISINESFDFLDYFFIVSFFIASGQDSGKMIQNFVFKDESEKNDSKKEDEEKNKTQFNSEIFFSSLQDEYDSSTFFEEFLEFYSMDVNGYRNTINKLNQMDYDRNFEDIFYL